MEAEKRCATCEELCRYIKEEVKPGDIVRLSLGRVYIPGKVITNNNGIIQVKIDSEMIKGLTTIDVEKLKDYLIELEHECEGSVCIIEAVDEEEGQE
ncbi:MAG TPA: DUF2097 family protein [Methanothermobacter sp.]|jgi:hypothetical protein|uniref:DUF2097 domain-containing protein n=1 Tax=Methanothermobacter tenebrarum TaxID=680118 RepID=A0ABM7YFM7_9EURY|nr:DUF2097 domain-containing protein [Methanothermobacter tenebrarum]MDI6882676.1 DUF2097 domain-containing protein [Methanothermobacter sp.]MDX9693677.1 DUF2097 domain-containing protein [Methanothermobacter sp.]BDH80165.1 hypothetical protein MTTB_15440 [Methanothermobacter tenebrarum]HHW17158.1 DUF2097 family protein [Methanothermobacter sp.]HOQ19708.1 DUF2097 domain-containing protein [Methanothermobacter sp.]